MKTWLLLAALLSTPAEAVERRLSLEDAVQLALRLDPTVAEAKIAEDRGKLAVLRAQLDRVSLKIDGQIQELFNKSNIGGPTLFNPNCSGPFGNLPLDATTCGGIPGSTYTQTALAEQQPQTGLGAFSLAAQLNVPIFSGLRVESNVTRAKKLHDLSTVNIRQARKDTALAVARAYWGVRRLALLLEVQDAALVRLRDAEAVTDGRVKAGLAPPIDRNRATVRRLQQGAAIADLVGQLHEATAQLAVAIGVEDTLVLTDLPNFPEQAPPDAGALVADAKVGRPEIAAARLTAEAQHQAVKMAMSNFYPQLNGFGLFQLTNNAFNPLTGSRSVTGDVNPFSDIAGTLTLGVTLSMNFFDTLNTWTGSKDARYEEARLWEERRRAERQVDADVRIAHARLIKLYDKRRMLAEARDIARDNSVILEARYKNGDALVIEYLDGQTELINAEQQMVDATAQLMQQWLELEASLGRTVGVTK